MEEAVSEAAKRRQGKGEDGRGGGRSGGDKEEGTGLEARKKKKREWGPLDGYIGL